MFGGKISNGNGTILHDLYGKHSQSPYYDNLSRPISDLLPPFIAAGIRGVTSNPTIFERAITLSNTYNEQLRNLVGSGKDLESAYWEGVVKDIKDACKPLEPIYNENNGLHGYVSFEVFPKLANNTKGTTEAAKWLHNRIGFPNVYIKIPATKESISSVKEVISHGISLIFCLSQYEAVIDAYLDGLEASEMADLSRFQVLLLSTSVEWTLQLTRNLSNLVLLSFLILGKSCTSSFGVPALPEKVLRPAMGEAGEERCQEAEVDVGINQCEKCSIP
ncbi:hypothetical protein HN51_012741 [Arachis hypogaea]|nr:Transaldolase [Arachis hypogaea]